MTRRSASSISCWRFLKAPGTAALGAPAGVGDIVLEQALDVRLARSPFDSVLEMLRNEFVPDRP